MITELSYYNQIKKMVEEWANELESLSGTDRARWVKCNGWSLVQRSDIHRLAWTGRKWKLPGTNFQWSSRRQARTAIKGMDGQLIMDISVQPQRPVEYISVDFEFTNK